MSGYDDLLRDPETRKCWREVVTGEDALTIDGVRACFGEEADDNRSLDDALYEALSLATGTTSAQGESRAFEETSANESPAEPDLTAGLDADERRLLRALEAVSGTTPPEPSEGGFVLVPEPLVRRVEETYDVVSRWGFLTDEDLAAWLAENVR